MEFVQELGKGERAVSCPKSLIPSLCFIDTPAPCPLQAANFTQTLTSYSPSLTAGQARQDKRQGSMSRSPPNAIQLRSVGSQGTMASLPQPSAVQNPSSHSWASVCGSPPWGLSCLLALQVGAEVQELVLAEGGVWREEVWHEKPSGSRYFCLFLKTVPLPAAYLGPGFSALRLPPAPASMSPCRRTLFLPCPAPGLQPLFMWRVYSPANLDGQQVRGTPWREGNGVPARRRGSGRLSAAPCFQTCLGCCSYRLPLIQAPSLEFLIPGLVLTSQKLPLTTRTPGNCEHRARAQGEGEVGCSPEHTVVSGCRIEMGQ